MCLAIPGQIVQWQERDSVFASAVVDFGGVRRPVSMACVPDAAEGDYVLVHAGFAIQRVDQEEAQVTLALFAGLKLSAVYSTIGAVIGEWVGAGAGLGYLMLSANAQLRIAMVFGAIVCLTRIGLGLLAFVTWLERRLLPWQYLSRDDVALPQAEP